MIITREVQKRLEDFQPDYVFTYRDLNLPAETSESIIKMLNRLAGEGYLAKISKGRFYKPKKSVFGTLKPRQEELVKDLLEKNGKRIGYLTGYSVFNRLGLTTQVPNIIQIGTNQRRNKKQRDIFTVSAPAIIGCHPLHQGNTRHHDRGIIQAHSFSGRRTWQEGEGKDGCLGRGLSANGTRLVGNHHRERLRYGESATFMGFIESSNGL